MKSKLLKSVLATTSVGLLVGLAPAAHALPTSYSATFQDVTFNIVQTDSNTITFEILNADNASGDWATANFLGAFDLKNLGLNFGTATGTANGPGATNLVGLNAQLSANSQDCVANGTPPGSICFDLSPDTPLLHDMVYTIDFSSDLNIAATGPHLQVAFTNTVGGAKVGTLYSQDVGASSTSGGSVFSRSRSAKPLGLAH